MQLWSSVPFEPAPVTWVGLCQNVSRSSSERGAEAERRTGGGGGGMKRKKRGGWREEREEEEGEKREARRICQMGVSL